MPATLAIVYRAWSHKSLTPAGCVAATLTAAAHAVHPWVLPFALLMVFFFAGTRVTKVGFSFGNIQDFFFNNQQIKHDVKAKLTMQSSGSSGGEGARTHIQGKQAAQSGRRGRY